MRHRVFASITIILSLSASLYGAELLLAHQREVIEGSDRLQPGMILYDPRLGWRLKPNWFGSHKHHDFEVDYSINRFGLRGRPPAQSTVRHVAVVGDSFAFGLGVDDDQTFVHLLDERDKETGFLNFSVPGYSTDQQYLMIRDRVRLFKPDLLLLVVYLGNDLIDNERPFPLQGDHAKPYFQLQSDGGLALLNSPVPRESKPAAARGDNLTDLVLDQSQGPSTLLQRYLGDLEISRRIGLFQALHRWGDESLEARFGYRLKLFRAIMERMLESVGGWQAEFKLVLLPGRSFVEQPLGLSAGYQDFLRRAILHDLSSMDGIEIIDLAKALREARKAGIGGLYHPNEGHLSTAGHAFVAGVLAERLLPDK